MSASSLALRKAIVAALASDAAVTAAVGDARIFDDVPRGANYPYIVVADMAARDYSSDETDAEEHGIRLHIWSRAKGSREAESIAVAIRDALHDVALALDGCTLVNLRWQSFDVAREADGETRRGILQFRAVTEVNRGG